MPLKARVGRHAKTGRNCQNWKKDQEHVIKLLNKISIDNGGAGGAIKAPVIAGYASQQLYTAILYFQNKHFPVTPSGFVDPGGPVLAKMEALAAAARPAPPAKHGQWEYIVNNSVIKAMNKGISDDNKLDHDEVVNIVRATFSDGRIDQSELKDLLTIATDSKTISPRSKALLEKLVHEESDPSTMRGAYSLPLEKHRFAAEIVCDFLKGSSGTYFPHLDRNAVGVGLLMRIANPGLMNQGDAPLCGPTALIHTLATDHPGQYARFAIDLYEKGKAKLGRLTIEPGKDVRSHKPAGIPQVDWLTMASIRDSENWFFDYQSVTGGEIPNPFVDTEGWRGMTMPNELARWFQKAGYSDVRNVTNLVFNKKVGTIDEVNRLFDQRYRVCLFVGINMLKSWKQTEGSTTAEHWIVLKSHIERSNGKIKMTVFTWGEGDYQVPNGSEELSVDDFLKNFYGYVAAKA